MVRMLLLSTCVLALLIGVPVGAQPTPVPPPVQFQEVTASLGVVPLCIDLTQVSKGGDWCAISVADFNGDGWDDVVLDTHPGIHWYKNNQNSTFTKIASPLPPVIPDITEHRHVLVWCDIDQDGREDLIVGTGFLSPLRVNLWMRNNGDGTFTDIAPALGTSDPGSNDWSITCFDADKDGRLDVLQSRAAQHIANDLSNHLWMSNGVTFTQQAYDRGLNKNTGAPAGRNHGRPYAADCADFNRTGFIDCIQTGNNFGQWLINTGGGMFLWRTGAYEPMVDLSPYLHDGQFYDFNGDGLLDAAIVDSFTTKGVGDNAPLRVHCNNGSQALGFGGRPLDGLRNCWKTPELFNTDPRSLAVGDFDNDGWPDAFLTRQPMGVVTKQPDWLWMNDGSGTPFFTDKAAVAGVAGPVGTKVGGGGAAIIDYDRDGRLDLIVGYQALYYPGPFKLYRNISPVKNWVGFMLTGPMTIGTWIEATACGRRQVHQLTARTGWLSQDSRNVHFGLGDCPGPISVMITWPSGVTRTVEYAANFYYIVTP